MKIPKNFNEWFAETDDGRAVIAEAAADEVSERKTMVEKAAELRAALLKAVGPARKLIEKESAAVEKKRKALTAASMELRTAQADVHNLTHRADHEIGQLEQRLREGAILGLRPFIDTLAELWDVERRAWSWNAPRDRKGVPMPARDRVAHIRSIQKRAEALLLIADPAEAEAELAKLRAELAQSEAVAA